jgi:hypothetical protein
MKVWRPWRFGLRTVFVLLTIVAVWLGVISHRARQQRAAVEKLRSAGAVVGFKDTQPFGAWVHGLIGDEYGRTVWGVAYHSAQRELSDEDLTPLCKLSALTALYVDPILGGTEVSTFREKRGFERRCGTFTKAGLSELGKLTTLTQLWVVSKEIDDDVLLAWQSLVNLETLKMGTPSLTAEGIRRFQAAVPGCKVEVDVSAVFWWEPLGGANRRARVLAPFKPHCWTSQYWNPVENPTMAVPHAFKGAPSPARLSRRYPCAQISAAVMDRRMLRINLRYWHDHTPLFE